MNIRHLCIPAPSRAAAACALLAAVAAAMPGCRGERSDSPPREFLPDMDNQQKFRSQTRTEFFSDNRAMRPSVAGSVAFGRTTNPAAPGRDRFLKNDDAFFRGLGVDGKPLDYIPASAIDAFLTPANTAAVDAAVAKAAAADPSIKDKPAELDKIKRGILLSAMLTRGQERFNIYCSACHGYQGDGHGMVAQRWSGGVSAVANYHDPKFSDRSADTGKDGHIFIVIREGLYDIDPATKEVKYRMPSYAHAVSETDAWAIVSYVRALQASWRPADKLSAAEIAKVAGKRPDPPPAPPAPPAKPGAATPAGASPAGATPPGATPPATPPPAKEGV